MIMVDNFSFLCCSLINFFVFLIHMLLPTSGELKIVILSTRHKLFHTRL